MKKLFLTTTLALTVSFQLAAQVRFERFSRVSLTESFNAQVEVNQDTVRCSHVGYGASELKINVPSLRWNAMFDHSNAENLGPCMTAGLCRDEIRPDGLSPEDLILGRPGSEDVTIQKELVENFSLDHVKLTCTRTVTENLETVIRGQEFTHRVTKQLGDLPFEVCLKIKNEEKQSIF